MFAANMKWMKTMSKETQQTNALPLWLLWGKYPLTMNSNHHLNKDGNVEDYVYCYGFYIKRMFFGVMVFEKKREYSERCFRK